MGQDLGFVLLEAPAVTPGRGVPVAAAPDAGGRRGSRSATLGGSPPGPTGWACGLCVCRGGGAPGRSRRAPGQPCSGAGGADPLQLPPRAGSGSLACSDENLGDVQRQLGDRQGAHHRVAVVAGSAAGRGSGRTSRRRRSRRRSCASPGASWAGSSRVATGSTDAGRGPSGWSASAAARVCRPASEPHFAVRVDDQIAGWRHHSPGLAGLGEAPGEESPCAAASWCRDAAVVRGTRALSSSRRAHSSRVYLMDRGLSSCDQEVVRVTGGAS